MRWFPRWWVISLYDKPYYWATPQDTQEYQHLDPQVPYICTLFIQWHRSLLREFPSFLGRYTNLQGTISTNYHQNSVLLTLFFLSTSGIPGAHPASNINDYHVFFGGKMRTARVAALSAVPIVPNLTVMMEAQHSFPPCPSLRELSHENPSFIFTFTTRI